MYREDITGSIAHATMLGKCGIIEKSEAELICKPLDEIISDIENNRLDFASTNSPIVCGNSNYYLRFIFSDAWKKANNT